MKKRTPRAPYGTLSASTALAAVGISTRTQSILLGLLDSYETGGPSREERLQSLSLGDVAKLDAATILASDGCGPGRLREIRRVLARAGLWLREEPTTPPGFVPH